MKSDDNAPDEAGNEQQQPSGFAKIIKPLGALIATGLILYFLFGIPAYLLFRDS